MGGRGLELGERVGSGKIFCAEVCARVVFERTASFSYLINVSG